MIFGSQTRASLRAFQLDRRMPADGYPSLAMIEAVAKAAAELP